MMSGIQERSINKVFGFLQIKKEFDFQERSIKKGFGSSNRGESKYLPNLAIIRYPCWSLLAGEVL